MRAGSDADLRQVDGQDFGARHGVAGRRHDLAGVHGAVAVMPTALVEEIPLALRQELDYL